MSLIDTRREVKIIIHNNFQTLDYITNYNLLVFFVCSVRLPIQYLHFGSFNKISFICYNELQILKCDSLLTAHIWCLPFQWTQYTRHHWLLVAAWCNCKQIFQVVNSLPDVISNIIMLLRGLRSRRKELCIQYHNILKCYKLST